MRDPLRHLAGHGPLLAAIFFFAGCTSVDDSPGGRPFFPNQGAFWEDTPRLKPPKPLAASPKGGTLHLQISPEVNIHEHAQNIILNLCAQNHQSFVLEPEGHVERSHQRVENPTNKSM